MNDVAQTADASLCRTMGANRNDEIPGLGPAWACDRFGHYGHNYYCCIECTSNFMTRNETHKGATHATR